MKITKRMTQGALIKYANFADGSHINLIRLKTPYANGDAYRVAENTTSIFCSSGMFKTYEQALEKFNLMLKKNACFMSDLVSVGYTNNSK